MDDRQKNECDNLSDQLDELMERNKHLKWPVIFLIIVIIVLVILADIFSPGK